MKYSVIQLNVGTSHPYYYFIINTSIQIVIEYTTHDKDMLEMVKHKKGRRLLKNAEK